MFIWIGARMGMGSAGVKYCRGSSSSIGWFWTGMAAIPWIIVSSSSGIGEASAV